MDIVAVYHLSHSSSYTNEFTHKLGHDIRVDEVDKSVHSAQDTSTEITTGAQENIDSELHVGRPASSHGMSEKLNLCSDPIPNGNQSDFVPNLDVVSSNTSPDRKLANTDNEVDMVDYQVNAFLNYRRGKALLTAQVVKLYNSMIKIPVTFRLGVTFPRTIHQSSLVVMRT